LSCIACSYGACLRVPGEVVFEDAHEDDGEEGGEEEHEHEGVDDGEPVNLEAARQEAAVVVAGHAVFPLERRLGDPLHAGDKARHEVNTEGRVMKERRTTSQDIIANVSRASPI